MAFWPNSIATPHELRTRTGDNRDMLVFSGYAVFTFRGSGQSWKRDDLYISIGPLWRRLDDVTPIVSLASIANENTAVDAGWAVDNVRWTTYGGRILLQSQVAIRDIDGLLLRVAYQATAIGLI